MAIAQDKLRQIAILVSSVDAATARQLLLHLPTEAAKQVRAMSSQLGTISAEEKRKILAEFQRSATAAAVPQGRNYQPPPSPTSGLEGSRGGHDGPASAGFARTQPETPVATTNWAETANSELGQSGSNAAWTRLSIEALVHFVRSERAAVTAVVIGQLAPQVAVQVLQRLPPNVGNDVLHRLSRLQEIDPEAMAAIDDHLSRRLTEYQHHIESESENQRRIHALLAAAPSGLRQQWSQQLGMSTGQSSESSADGAGMGAPAVNYAEAANHAAGAATTESDLLELGGSVITTQQFASAAGSAGAGDVRNPSESMAAQHAVEDRQAAASSVGGSSAVGDPSDDGHILKFPQSETNTFHTTMDRSLTQIEFERILELPPHALAALLTATESETVLLALAGASPEFMQRFYRMLDRADAKALKSSLQRIGSIQLRDVDEAQRRIVENAVALARRNLPASTTRKAA